MSYKCKICDSSVAEGQPMRRHIVKKPDGNVLQEVPVCESCQAGLRSGHTLAQMVAQEGPKQEGPLPKAVLDLAKPAAKVVPKTLAPVARPVFKSFKDIPQLTKGA